MDSIDTILLLAGALYFCCKVLQSNGPNQSVLMDAGQAWVVSCRHCPPKLLFQEEGRGVSGVNGLRNLAPHGLYPGGSPLLFTASPMEDSIVIELQGVPHVLGTFWEPCVCYSGSVIVTFLTKCLTKELKKEKVYWTLS